MWTIAKIASIFILFGVAALSGLFPRFIVRCLSGKLGTSRFVRRIPGALNCFSGGVFFAVVFIDLLPESREDMEYVFDQRDIDIDFPVSESILGVGFIFVLLLEHIALQCMTNITSKNDYLDSKNVEMSARREDDTNNTSSNVSSTTGVDNITYLQDENTVGQRSESVQAAAVKNGCPTSPVKDNQLEASEHKDDDDKKKQRTLRNYVLLIVLTVHMFFDGISIGLLNKDFLIWQLLLAQCIHKTLVFLTIGIQVQQMYPSMIKVGIIIIYFATVTPLSVIVGGLVSSIDDEVKHRIVSSVLMSFSAGNFLFITFFEILQRELANHQHDLFKVFSIFIGFASFALLRYFFED